MSSWEFEELLCVPTEGLLILEELPKSPPDERMERPSIPRYGATGLLGLLGWSHCFSAEWVRLRVFPGRLFFSILSCSSSRFWIIEFALRKNCIIVSLLSLSFYLITTCTTSWVEENDWMEWIFFKPGYAVSASDLPKLDLRIDSGAELLLLETDDDDPSSLYSLSVVTRALTFPLGESNSFKELT